MKILCLSDLHRLTGDMYYLEHQNKKLVKILNDTCPDIVVITGDVYESNEFRSPYKDLAKVFDDIPVVCVLGNHEFSYKTVEKTLEFYNKFYDPDRYNVHYLDIIGHYDFEIDECKVRFVGNVLWYDGSMSNVPNQEISTFANGRWLDRTIKEFDYISANNDCVDSILNNISKEENVHNILCTHCVPHYLLNEHMKDVSEFNAYSGMYNFLDCVEGLEYSISGHTHRRTIGQKINGISCINVGSDYHSLEYYLLEI